MQNQIKTKKYIFSNKYLQKNDIFFVVRLNFLKNK